MHPGVREGEGGGYNIDPILGVIYRLKKHAFVWAKATKIWIFLGIFSPTFDSYGHIPSSYGHIPSSYGHIPWVYVRKPGYMSVRTGYMSVRTGYMSVRINICGYISLLGVQFENICKKTAKLPDFMERFFQSIYSPQSGIYVICIHLLGGLYADIDPVDRGFFSSEDPLTRGPVQGFGSSA